MSQYKLLIFDCDGVLVDSERITNQIYVEMLNELGLELTLPDVFERFVGHSMGQCMSMIADMLGGEPPPEFLPAYRERAKQALESQLRPVPGIESVLDAISIPWCVASSGSHEKMRSTLGITGLWPRFEGRIFSVTDVARPKPAPDVFLHAAAALGVAPGDCAVVEDSPTGVTAAVSAGMTVFGYSALTPARRLLAAGASRAFASMSELPGLVQGADLAPHQSFKPNLLRGST